MKRTIILTLLMLVTLKLFAPNKMVTDHLIILAGEKVKLPPLEFKKLQLELFSNSIAYYESGFNCDTVNTSGYCGKYQMGIATRIETGYGKISTNNFRKNPKIWSECDQDIAFNRLVRLNAIRLEDIINKYDGKEFRGITITKSGILAAAHLGGFNSVRTFFERIKPYNPGDINGTTLMCYMVRFSGFEF